LDTFEIYKPVKIYIINHIDYFNF